MEIAFVLLLTVPLTVAVPLRPTHRSEGDAVLPVNTAQASEVKRSADTQEQYANALRIIPYQSDHLDLDALKRSMEVKFRLRRAPQRGCKLWTCQVHNLANVLYHLSKSNGKDESKKAHDPRGFGR